ncbi:MAG TPA: PQQ-binding-like beta-propeller repeat protein [Gemmataceae bacterium]|nr:PQQ-binding-like beta-propeller repeat protein [Gemmataceae bacterium]
MRRPLLALAVCAAMALAVRASDWPQFRGPNGSATSDDKKLPAEWDKDKNIAWKVKVPGYGWSGPIVWGDKVFVTTAVSDKQTKPAAGFGGGFGGGGPGGKGGFPPGGKGGFGMPKPPDAVHKWEVHCLNASDGKVVWKQTAKEGKPTVPIQASNTYASETPATDGERVYAYFGMHGVHCFDTAGKVIWSKDLGTYPIALGFGTGSSPVLADGKLFVQCDNEKESFLIALDAKTGEKVWRKDRTERTGWSSPIVWKNNKRSEVICVGPRQVRSYDPATGDVLWELGGMSGQPKASPVATDELLYVGTGGGPGGFGGGSRPLMAVKPGGSGDITLKGGAKSNDAIAWSQPQAGPQTASPLVYRDLVYVLDERGGVLHSYDTKTGKQVYKERIPGARGFTSSPWAYDDKVFCLDDAGTTHVVQAGPEFKVLGKNSLGEMSWSSPAAANGALYLRTVDHLYCIRTTDGSK